MNTLAIGGPCRLCGRPNIEHGNGQCPTITMTQLAPHQQRVVDEKAELDDRRAKLANFYSSPIFLGLPESEQSLLLLQGVAMRTYAEILGERIAGFGA